jgi:uncharacterized protein
MYKLSKYLLKKEHQDLMIIFNSLNKKIFAINKNKYKKIIDHKNNLKLLKENEPALFGLFYKLGNIIDNTNKELDSIVIKNREKIYDNSTYRLTINPTLDCNFSCWYCYEEHDSKRMRKKSIKIIESFVLNIVSQKGVKIFNLDWFGGEPLLYFRELVYEISKKIKEICLNNNVAFYNSITTNGYNISEMDLKLYNEIKLNNFQITIDGHKQIHDKIRRDKSGKPSYDKIMKNINLLADNVDNCKIVLRINYTTKTLRKIENVVGSIDNKNRKNITISFQQVWQDKDKNQLDVAYSIKKHFKDHNYKVDEPQYYNDEYVVCYADRFNQVVINYNLDVYKCTARDFNNYIPDGKLLDNGNIKWNDTLYNKRFVKSTFENQECMNCKFLPLCFGPCSQKCMENNMNDKSVIEKYCRKDGIVKGVEYMFNEFIEENNL